MRVLNTGVEVSEKLLTKVLVPKGCQLTYNWVNPFNETVELAIWESL